MLRELEIPTRPGQGPARFVRRVVSVLHLWESEMDLESSPVGVGLAGDVDSERGALRAAPNLPGWKGFGFRRAFARSLKRAVVVDNDANMAAWGGYVVELGRKPKTVVAVTLGTGVGGGLILGGKLHRGATGSAGEIGHARVELAGLACRCGARGCLEAYAGAYGLSRLARALLASRPRRPSKLRRLPPSALTPLLLAKAAEEGDSVAREVWRRAGEALAAGLAGVVLLLNPEVVLFMGGISRAGRLLLGPVSDAFRREPFRTPFKAVSLRTARNPHLGCVGAALSALEESASAGD